MNVKMRSNPAVAIRRAAISDGWLPKMRRAMRAQLAMQVKEAGQAVGEGRQKWAAEFVPRWAKSLAAAKLPLMLAMTMDGYHLAEVEFGKKAAIREMLAKDEIILEMAPPAPPISLGELETAFGHEAYLAQRLQTPVGDWVTMTSKWETETSSREIERIVRKAANEGLTPRETQKLLLGQLVTEAEIRDLPVAALARAKTRAELMARTTTIWSYNEGAKQLYADEGVGGMSWLTTSDDALCDFCEMFDGMEIPINDRFVAAGSRLEGERLESTEFGEFLMPTGGHIDIPFDVEHPPLHPNCLTQESTILAPGKLAGFVAPYSGLIVEILFSTGRNLACTPNHMLLTPLGFAKAKSLRQGDQVIYCPDFERIIGRNPNNNGHPTRIDDVVKAFTKSSGMTARSVPSASEYFHGDGAFVNGNVHIVTANGFLGSDSKSPKSKQIREFGFTGTDTELLGLSGYRDLTTVLFALAFAANRFVSTSSNKLTFGSTPLRHSETIRLSLGSRSNSCPHKAEFDSGAVKAKSLGNSVNRKPSVEVFDGLSDINVNALNGNVALVQAPVDGVLPAMERLGDVLHRFPQTISVCNIVGVNMRQFSGHVYDLQTMPSLYIANGIVSSNCRCALLASI